MASLWGRIIFGWWAPLGWHLLGGRPYKSVAFGLVTAPGSRADPGGVSGGGAMPHSTLRRNVMRVACIPTPGDPPLPCQPYCASCAVGGCQRTMLRLVSLSPRATRVPMC